MTLKWRLAKFLPLLLMAQLLMGFPQQIATTANGATVANCTTSQFTITAKHNSVFYFDDGTDITSGYAEYQIVNKGSSGTFWAKLENFTGGALALARFESATRSLGTMSRDASTNQYWYLTASAVSATSQAHDVVIYSSDPSSGGGTAVCKLSRGFTSTASTIAAAANKVTSVEYSALGTPGSSTFTATVKGQTGTIGQGPTKNSDVNLNPATHKDFAVGNYRLSQVSYQCTGGSAITGALYIPNACEGNYTAIFTFDYLTDVYPTGVVKSISPIMQIASGTQMKHTSATSFVIPVVGTVSTPTVTTVGATFVTDVAAKINGTIDAGTFTTTYFCYSTTAVIAPAHFDPTNATTCTKVNATSGTPYDFVSLTGLASKITYYFEYIGEVSGGTKYYGGVKQFRTLDPVPVATTDAATGLASTSATLNGNVTVFGNPDISSVYFILTKTSPGSLSGTPDRTRQLDPYANETITVTSPAVPNFSVTANDLVSNTTYFFELVFVDTSTAMYFGGVRSFTTSAATTFTITFNPNGGTLDSGETVDTATVTSGDNALLYKPTTNPTRENYEFLGWGSSSGSTTVLTTYTASSAATLYAIWRYNGPVAAPAPVYVPNPPTITSISVPEMCAAVGGQLIVNGTYLTGATAKVDGVAVRVLESSFGRLVVNLPAAPVGTKTITVTNIDGSASTTVKYSFVDSPVYVNFLYPATYKDMEFSYIFTATNTDKYSISGVMPTGLTLNALTGEISGTPTQIGDFLFTIVASNLCDQIYLDVYMFVDKAIPATYTCTVQFNVPRSDNITDYKISQLQLCLGKIKTLTPETIDPIIFISGGLPAGLSVFDSLTHPRYMRIFEIIKDMGLDVQIYLGAFDGTPELVQLNVYWPMP